MAKLGFDRQLNDDLRVRLTGSYRTQESAISNTLYSGDRAGARYYYVLENWKASESSQFTSGRVNPGFSDHITAMMINPFVKYRGFEFFGMYETASGRAAPNTNPDRDVTQLMAEGLYRFGHGEKFYVGGRWNTLDGDFGATATDGSVARTQFGAGWFVTPSLLLKFELVNQSYDGFATTDIRTGGKFRGFMIEAVTAF
jgi:hypothetical protein